MQSLYRIPVPNHESFYASDCIKASGIDNRKLACVVLILANLRLSIRESFHVSLKYKNFCGWALILQVLISCIPSSLIAYGYGPPSSNQLFKGGANPASHPPVPPPAQPTPPSIHPIQKPALPLMSKPFGMPGVIGLQDGKWVGTDYLGFLTNHIGIDVEILKPESVQYGADSGRLRDVAAKAFDKYNLISNSEVVEGPLLPFLHILITIFPVDRDKYVIFGSSRLFEQVQVVRKDFTPAGFWQGITWESQDITLASEAELNAKVEKTVDQLAVAFATRYRQYNLGKSEPLQK